MWQDVQFILVKILGKKYDIDEVLGKKYDIDEILGKKYDIDEILGKKYDIDEILLNWLALNTNHLKSSHQTRQKNCQKSKITFRIYM